jgi:daunorubicin resistance ABC transporter ATP-binding subunit
MGSPTIEVRGVGKSFGRTRALADVSLSADAGRVLALLGPNGAGKTTLVRILTTLTLPDEGTARVAGFDVVSGARGLRSVIGLAGQFAAVDELLTGRENLELVGSWYHLSRREYRDRAEELLDRFALGAVGERLVKTYSGGMRRRLDIAASLIGRPPVLFLDEPTTGLDPRTRNDLWRFVEDLVAAGTTVLLTTQYMEEAERLANRIAVLDAGRVIAEGTADTLKDALGGDVLEVRVSETADLSAVAAVLADVAGAEPRTDADRHLVSIPVREGTPMLIAVGRRLEAMRITPADLGVRRPTLDDVFLTLTGETVDTAPPAEAGAIADTETEVASR